MRTFAIAASVFTVGVFVEATSASAGERCVRNLEPSDVYFQLRGDELSIVTANLQGPCDLILLQRPLVGPRKDVVVGYYNLSGLAPEAWLHEWLALPGSRPGDAKITEIRLEPGNAVVQRTDMASVVRHLAAEARANRQPALPSGSKILVKVTHLAEFKGRVDEPEFLKGLQQNIMSVESPTLIYRLPPPPP